MKIYRFRNAFDSYSGREYNVVAENIESALEQLKSEKCEEDFREENDWNNPTIKVYNLYDLLKLKESLDNYQIQDVSKPTIFTTFYGD